MIGVGIAFILVGVLFLFLVPWVGIPVGIIGLVLAILWMAGFGRGAVHATQAKTPRRLSHGDRRSLATGTAPRKPGWVGRPPPHVHGKEGVDGSSPSEGFTERPAKRYLSC